VELPLTCCVPRSPPPYAIMCSWACVYKWMRTSPANPLCPACKACLSEDRIIPLYGRGRPEVDPRKDSRLRAAISDERDAVPARPPAPTQRAAASPVGGARQLPPHLLQQPQVLPPGVGHRRAPSWGIDGWNWSGGLIVGGERDAGGGGALSAGVNAFASLWGLQLVFPPAPNDPGGMVQHDLTAEQAQQAFLSRVLLLLGSLVIFCLLLF